MTRVYSLYSRQLTVEGWPELMAAIHGRLEPFATDGDPHPACSLSVSFVQGRPHEHPAAAVKGRRVYEFSDGHVGYDDERDLLTIAVADRIRGFCEPAVGRARIVVDTPEAADTWVLSHPVLSLVLMELLKRQGFFPVHAAGLALGGTGVLFAGTSGAGKSTLSVALVRSGCAFLADDTVFLEATASGWHARAFPDQIDLCTDARSLFPELQAVSGAGRDSGWPKFQLRAEQVYGASISLGVSPRILMFPSIRHTPTTTLRRLSAAAALLELAPNVLLTHAGTAQEHFDALAGLVAQCACYRLDTGRDLDDAVSVVRRAMES